MWEICGWCGRWRSSSWLDDVNSFFGSLSKAKWHLQTNGLGHWSGYIILGHEKGKTAYWGVVWIPGKISLLAGLGCVFWSFLTFETYGHLILAVLSHGLWRMREVLQDYAGYEKNIPLKFVKLCKYLISLSHPVQTRMVNFLQEGSLPEALYSVQS
jgi:hypothetical protein